MDKLILIAVLFIITADMPAQQRNITVFIRIDDIFMKESSIRPQEADSFLCAAERHKAHVMLCVIPARLLQEPNEEGEMSASLSDYARRGHQIVQHGYNHRCSITGSTDWEFYTPGVTHSTEEMTELIAEGKGSIEAVTGTPVNAYVGAGNDNDYALERNEAELRQLGFTWLTDRKCNAPYIKNNNAYFFSLEEYAWALDDTNYAQKLDEAKAAFTSAVSKSDCWGVLFHDHFTRYAYRNGITIKFLDELLSWMESLPAYRICYRTCDEWYAEHKER